MLILRDVDHRFYGMSITHSTACRSPTPRDVDHPLHGMSIAKLHLDATVEDLNFKAPRGQM